MSDPVRSQQHVSTPDGRRLFVERVGTGPAGAPTVVLEAGMGASGASWGAVVPLLADRLEVVTYDRSGLGRSPADPAPRGLDRLVADHLCVLDHLGSGPFVLVGHSWGGPIVRKAAAAVPGRVAGLVLVDATDELCDLFFDGGNERQNKLMAGPLLPLAARIGLCKLVTRNLAKQLPEPAASRLRAEDGTVAAIRTQQAELVGHLADLRALRDEPEALPDVPVVVISGEVVGKMEGKRRPDLIAAHRKRAEGLPQGRHVLATRSAHLVPLTEPRVVADEVLRIVDGPSP